LDAPKSNLETEKTLKLSLLGKYIKKPKKTQTNPKKPTGLVFFFFKPGFFPTLAPGAAAAPPEENRESHHRVCAQARHAARPHQVRGGQQSGL
jgi:hypothetical protein